MHYLQCLVGPKPVKRDKYVICFNLSKRGSDKKSVLSFDCIVSFSFPSDSLGMR